MTILSVNKTRDLMDAVSASFSFDGRCALIFCFRGTKLPSHHYHQEKKKMKMSVKFLTQSAIIAALYAVLTHLQNIILPGSATWAIQMRMSEALCVLAFFTPAAIPGLSLGCLLFNLTFAYTLPLDFVVGTLATFLAAFAMWKMRSITVKGYPLLGMLMPAIANAILVGWELTVYIGGGFAINALYVALGELAVLLVVGTVLYYAIVKRGLQSRFAA